MLSDKVISFIFKAWVRQPGWALVVRHDINIQEIYFTCSNPEPWAAQSTLILTKWSFKRPWIENGKQRINFCGLISEPRDSTPASAFLLHAELNSRESPIVQRPSHGLALAQGLKKAHTRHVYTSISPLPQKLFSQAQISLFFSVSLPYSFSRNLNDE